MSSKRKTRSSFAQVRQARPGGRWSVRYVVDGQRVSGGSYATEAAARRKQRELAYLNDTEELVQPRRPSRSLTLQEYVEQEYRPRRRTRESTNALHDGLFRVHLLGDSSASVPLPRPRLGTMPLSLITAAVVEQWWADRGRLGTPTARRQAYSHLRRVLSMAVADKVITENPCRIGREASPPRSNRPYIDPDLGAQLLAAVPEGLRAAFVVMLWGHLRRGELLGLSHGDYHPARGVLVVERQVHRFTGRLAMTPTKNGERKQVALPVQAREALERYLADNPARFERPRRASEPDPARWPRIFLHPQGQPLADHHLRVAWVKARKAVGRPDLHIHDLRHAGLTWAAQAGASTAEIMARGGHKDHRTAMGYQHADPARDLAIAEALAKGWAR